MNEYQDKAIKYAIDFERYKNGQANEIVSMLDKADLEIAAYIKKTSGVYTKQRYKEIAKKLRDVSAALKDSVDKGTDIDGVIEYELRKQRKLLNSVKGGIIKARGGEVNFLYPSVEQIRTSALFKPVTDGFTYDGYLNGIEEGLFNVWDSAVRTGYLTGQTTKEIAYRVMGGVSAEAKLKNPGLINSLRNSIYGNTRTLLQSFANETMGRIYEKNERYFGDGTKNGPKYQYLAVLDSRTCIVCGSDDGRLFNSLSDKNTPRVPRHRGCRCFIIPYFDIEGETRAGKDGYVSDKVTFEDWLKRQDEGTQKDVLGRTRYELFRRGEPISQFVDSGKILDLDELNARILKDKNIDIKAYFRHNVSEPDITKLSSHVKARLEERNVRLDDIYDALSNPLYVGDVRAADAAYQVIGANATVGVSAFDGAITTCWKTGKSAIYKIKKGKMK